MNDVVFTKGEGGLGRTLPKEDQYSGLVFYSDTKPAGFDTNIKQITSLADAETKGITSDHANDLIQVIHYHLKQFFAIYDFKAATPMLWVNIADVPAGAYDFTELTELQTAAGGKLRQIGVSIPAAQTTAQIAAINAVAVTLDGNHQPCSVLVNFDNTAVADWTAVDDLTLTHNKVLGSIAQDGGGAGAALWDEGNLGFSVGDIGALLGWASVKNIHENIGWVKNFNIAFNGEFDEPALANGDLISENESVLASLHAKRYVFLKKHIGISGTYYNDSHMCNALNSDYAYLENNQVIDEAIRGIRAYLLPELNAPLTIDATNGQLAPETVGYFESLAKKKIREMTNDGYISGGDAFIEPTQDVLSTSTLEIDAALVVKGVARNIKVNIGFTKQVE